MRFGARKRYKIVGFACGVWCIQCLIFGNVEHFLSIVFFLRWRAICFLAEDARKFAEGFAGTKTHVVELPPTQQALKSFDHT